MEEIKLFDGVKITVDGETEVVESPQEMFKELNMAADTPDMKEARIAVLRYLLSFHRMDLSAAYAGHTVTIEIVPTKEETDDEENVE